MNKKAVELSINFLVVTILSLVVLSLGIVLLRNIFSDAGELTASIDQSVQAELQAAVSQGKSVYVYPKTATIPGSEGQVFGVSVLNLISDTLGSTDQIKIEVLFNKSFDDENNPQTVSISNWVLNPSDQVNGDTITKKESEIFPILIQPVKGDNAPDGTYVFNVKVFYNKAGSWPQYGDTQKVYLTIA